MQLLPETSAEVERARGRDNRPLSPSASILLPVPPAGGTQARERESGYGDSWKVDPEQTESPAHNVN